jgi:hypothetical protein
MEVFHWEDYKRIAITKFGVPPDHFEEWCQWYPL